MELKAEVVNGSALWLRREPSTSGATIAMMYQGERMRVLERGETWSKVEYAGQTGYAMSQYLRFYEEEAWSGEVVENVEAEVVNGSALWLRREPSTSGATIAMMYQGERMRVLEKGGDVDKGRVRGPDGVRDDPVSGVLRGRGAGGA